MLRLVLYLLLFLPAHLDLPALLALPILPALLALPAPLLFPARPVLSSLLSAVCTNCGFRHLFAAFLSVLCTVGFQYSLHA